MKIVKVTYGIGYGTHETVLEFDDTATEDEIEEEVSDYVQEKLSWGHEIIENEDGK